MLKNILFAFVRSLPLRKVYAHCDIPCGMYTIEPAETAVKTVVRMVELIQQKALPDWDNEEAVADYHNAVSRYVATKEFHAQKCKEELLILWTDYFKPEHLKMFPDLHERFWQAAKLCSKNKQNVSMDTAQELQEAVEEIGEIFHKAQAQSKKS